MRTVRALGALPLLLLLSACAGAPPSIDAAAGCGYSIDADKRLLVISESASDQGWLDDAACVLEAVKMPTDMQDEVVSVSSGTGRQDISWQGFSASYGREGDALVIAIAEDPEV